MLPIEMRMTIYETVLCTKPHISASDRDIHVCNPGQLSRRLKSYVCIETQKVELSHYRCRCHCNKWWVRWCIFEECKQSLTSILTCALQLTSNSYLEAIVVLYSGNKFIFNEHQFFATFTRLVLLKYLHRINTITLTHFYDPTSIPTLLQSAHPVSRLTGLRKLNSLLNSNLVILWPRLNTQRYT
jgi:hypothetical protein